MIEPYYQEAGITVYNADCMDVLTQIEVHKIGELRRKALKR